MLQLQDVTVQFGTKTVLNQLSLSFAEGEISGIIGFNGAGKTTLLRSIKGLVRFNGSMLWKGQPVNKRQVSLLETQNYFYSNITGKEYLQLFEAQNPHFQVSRWNELMELPLHQLIEGYSTGMKKKLAIMGLLSFDREIVILDEPFNGLDLEAALHLRTILEALKKNGATVLLTSHILETLLPVCSQVSLLQGGSIKKTYQPAEFTHISEDLEAGITAKGRAVIGEIFAKGKKA